jgi:tol-pal system protein YbgF
MGRFCKFEFGYVMNKRVVSISVLSTVLLLTGCGSVQTQQAPVEVAQAPQPPQNQEVLKALAQLDEIKDGGEVQIDPVTGEVIAADGSTQTQQPDGSAGNVGSATQVVVESGQNTTGSDTTAVDSSRTTAVVVSAPATNGSVTLDEQNAYEQAFDLLKQSRYEDAILGFQTLVDTWPTSQLADDAYYWMSEARYVNREFEHALSGFRTVVSRYPDSQRVPEALLKIGYIQYDIGAYEDAAETFRDILARFPGHQVTVSAQTRLRRIEQTIQ